MEWRADPTRKGVVVRINDKTRIPPPTPTTDERTPPIKQIREKRMKCMFSS